MVEMDETEDEMMAGQRSPKTRPTRYQPPCHGHAISFIYLITVVEINQDIMKITVHSELNNYFSIHGK